MNLGFGQIILILIVGFLLFSDLPSKSEELAKAFKTIRKSLSDQEKDQEKDQENTSSREKEK
ncbi:MAG: hypothetical protein AAF705_12155 [Bacteroidota bacterium]